MTLATPVDTLPRLRDWPERLDALLRARAEWPFVWGVHDCCTFCADAVLAITGVDVMGTLRQRYQSAFEALARPGRQPPSVLGYAVLAGQNAVYIHSSNVRQCMVSLAPRMGFRSTP